MNRFTLAFVIGFLPVAAYSLNYDESIDGDLPWITNQTQLLEGPAFVLGAGVHTFTGSYVDGDPERLDRILIETAPGAYITSLALTYQFTEQFNGHHTAYWLFGKIEPTSIAWYEGERAIRRAPQLGQNPRRLHENATSFSAWHASHFTRRKPCSSRPHFR